MPQNKTVLQSITCRNITAPKVLKPRPGSVLGVVCLKAGTIDIINDITTGGAGASINGFPATLTTGQFLPLNSSASVGISVKTVSGGGQFNVVIT